MVSSSPEPTTESTSEAEGVLRTESSEQNVAPAGPTTAKTTKRRLPHAIFPTPWSHRDDPVDPDKPTPSPQKMFQKDFDALSMITAVAAIIAGVLQLGLPSQIIRVLQLDGATPLGLRVLGGVGLAIGIGLAINARFPPRRQTIGIASAVFLGSGVFLLGAPFAFGVNVGWFGWLVIFGAAVFVFAAAVAWFFLHDWLTPTPDYVPPPDPPAEAPPDDLTTVEAAAGDTG